MSYAVIIPSHNRPNLLKRALESIYAQTLLPESIYLIVDEPEDTQKYAFLRDYGDELKVTFTGGGFGGAKARNAGLDQVKGVDYVFFLDDDDEWLPEKSAKQVALLEARPDAVAVTCHSLKHNVLGKHSITRSERDVNLYVRLWNYTGGFSCFGMRWNKQTAHLRLRNKLKSAQDFEFYIRIAELGRIAVVDEVLMNFMAHGGVRISGDRIKKRQSYIEILQMHSDLFSNREKFFNVAKMELLSAPYLGGRVGPICRFLKGSFFLLLALKAPRLSRYLWMKSFKGIIKLTCGL